MVFEGRRCPASHIAAHRDLKIQLGFDGETGRKRELRAKALPQHSFERAHGARTGRHRAENLVSNGHRVGPGSEVHDSGDA